MWTDNIAILDRIDLDELERTLNKHTLEEVPVNQWTAFSWSVSRHGMFEACKRRYYLNYYGSRRVREANDEIVSAVWWLKQIQSLALWVGTVLHTIAGRVVKAHQQGQEIHHDDVVTQAALYFRDGVRASERGRKHDGSWIILQEHVYASEQVESLIAEAEDRVQSLTRTLLDSEGLVFITGLPSHAVKEVDEPFQSFVMRKVPVFKGDVKVFAIPDVLVTKGNDIHILDWKTGDVTSERLQDQAGIYRLYAHLAYSLPGERIHVYFIDLPNGGQMVEASGGTPSVEEAQQLAYQSIATMVEHMSDVGYNTVTIKDYPRTENTVLCEWCGFKRACWRE